MNTTAIHIIQDEKKTFQCKGYGNCRMIFTRSEHLARHERLVFYYLLVFFCSNKKYMRLRKHTGEVYIYVYI